LCNDYYTEPPFNKLQALDDEGLQNVYDFSIGRYGVGKVLWVGFTDVRGLDLTELVKIEPREVIVYPDESQKPSLGQGLNKPAIITLEGVLPPQDASNEQVRLVLV
jgi:nuclear pore complex protein Nup98-Nup96